ncbi:BA14K family protein [Ahrensia kielensis]|uniref:Lectin-like protein BA14k n=1 Tax=Ahrensia kielensis TaxID=76980 RepID=A0ABU9T753_9HYPH|nr:BA14K family protein [Ahrensia kielensis]
MMKAVKTSLAALAVASTTLVPMATSAQAGERGFARYEGQRIQHCGPRDRHCRNDVRVRDRHRPDKVIVKRRDNSGNIAAGVLLGVVGGVILNEVVRSNQQPTYVRPQPQYRAPTHNSNVYPPAPSRSQPRVVQYEGGYASLEPWTAGWYEYCDDRYRSFNAKTGTYRGYDGKDHFCVAR